MRSYLDFEKPVAELELQARRIARACRPRVSDIAEEIGRVEDKAGRRWPTSISNLTPWQKTLVARHPQRPHFDDFIEA